MYIFTLLWYIFIYGVNQWDLLLYIFAQTDVYITKTMHLKYLLFKR